MLFQHSGRGRVLGKTAPGSSLGGDIFAAQEHIISLSDFLPGCIRAAYCGELPSSAWASAVRHADFREQLPHDVQLHEGAFPEILRQKIRASRALATTMMRITSSVSIYSPEYSVGAAIGADCYGFTFRRPHRG